MGVIDATPHGFRSTFADWAADNTAYPQEVREQALAHAIPNRVEAAYRRGGLLEKRRRLMESSPDAVQAAYWRGDLFDKRRRLMDAWAAHCAKVDWPWRRR